MTRITIKEYLFWAYANLAMAHAALKDSSETRSYRRIHYMIRSRLYKRLMAGSMKLGSILDDERREMTKPSIWSFCGGSSHLSVDHLVSRKNGGLDQGDNLILACRTCNSSKGKKDLLEWYRDRESFPPLLILRRYIKIAYSFCRENGFLDKIVDEIEREIFPFRIDLLPEKFPPPYELCLEIPAIDQGNGENEKIMCLFPFHLNVWDK